MTLRAPEDIAGMLRDEHRTGRNFSSVRGGERGCDVAAAWRVQRAFAAMAAWSQRGSS